MLKRECQCRLWLSSTHAMLLLIFYVLPVAETFHSGKQLACQPAAAITSGSPVQVVPAHEATSPT